MPNYPKYQTPEHIHGELDRIIRDTNLKSIYKNNYDVVTSFFGTGFTRGMQGKDEQEIEMNAGSSNKDLSSKPLALAQEMYNLGYSIGIDLHKGTDKDKITQSDRMTLFETSLGHIVSYTNPEDVDEFRKNNRTSEFANLLTIESNVN